MPLGQVGRRRPLHRVRSAGEDHITGSGLQEETTSRGQVCRRGPCHWVRSAEQGHVTKSGLPEFQDYEAQAQLQPRYDLWVIWTQSWAPLLALTFFFLGIRYN